MEGTELSGRVGAHNTYPIANRGNGLKRVIYTFATGHPKFKTMARALAMSLELQGSTTPRLLMTDEPENQSLKGLYGQIIPPNPKYPHWFSKLAALEMTDADAIMFVDGDTLAVKNPDELFEKLKGIPFAVQGDLSEEDSWYGDFGKARRLLGIGAAPTFIGGWIYYERCPETENLIKEIMALADRYDELGPNRNMGYVVDEVCISLAMAKTGIGQVLPPSADISVATHYKMGTVKLDVLKGECTFIEAKYKPLVCKPTFYHSAMNRYDLRYWVQARRVMRVFARFPGWPKPKDSIPTKVWRRIVWISTTWFVELTGMDRPSKRD